MLMMETMAEGIVHVGNKSISPTEGGINDTAEGEMQS